MSISNNLPDCIYEVKLVYYGCASNDFDEYTICIGISYKKSSDDTYHKVSYRINISPYNGINILSYTKNGQRSFTKRLKKMAVFYMMIIYPDVVENVDMSCIDV